MDAMVSQYVCYDIIHAISYDIMYVIYNVGQMHPVFIYGLN